MSDIAERLRSHVISRGGAAKDETGRYVGTAWPMMLEAATTITELKKRIAELEADRVSIAARFEKEYEEIAEALTAERQQRGSAEI